MRVPRPMNTCMCAGSVGLTVSPSEELSTGHVAPAEQHQALGLDLVGDDALDDLAPGRLLRHEQRADRVLAGLRQLEADFGRLALEEGVRDLHQDAGAVAGARIGADRAAMLEVAENAERVGDDLVRLLALDVGDEADAAGILFQREIVEALGGRAPIVLAPVGATRPVSKPGPPTAHRQRCFRARTPTRSSHSSQSGLRASPSCVGAPWAFAAPTGPPLVLREPQFPKFRPGRSASPKNGPACCLFGASAPGFCVAIPVPGLRRIIETVLLS